MKRLMMLVAHAAAMATMSAMAETEKVGDYAWR